MGTDFSVIQQNLSYFLWGRTSNGQIGGLLLTVIMSLEAGVLALIFGVALGVLAFRLKGWGRHILFFTADLIRGIPLVFVIFWLFFLIPALFGASAPGSVTVVLALAWFSSAAVMYSTLSGLEALPTGQTEAGIAAGFSEGEILRLILLPQALRNLLPSFVGLFVALIKDTSLAFIVNVPELTYVASQVNNRTQLYPLQIYLFIAAVYFILCGGISLLADWLGRQGAGRAHAASV